MTLVAAIIVLMTAATTSLLLGYDSFIFVEDPPAFAPVAFYLKAHELCDAFGVVFLELFALGKIRHTVSFWI